MWKPQNCVCFYCFDKHRTRDGETTFFAATACYLSIHFQSLVVIFSGKTFPVKSWNCFRWNSNSIEMQNSLAIKKYRLNLHLRQKENIFHNDLAADILKSKRRNGAGDVGLKQLWGKDLKIKIVFFLFPTTNSKMTLETIDSLNPWLNRKFVWHVNGNEKFPKKYKVA